MSDPANSRPETAERRASALLAAAARAAHDRSSYGGVTVAGLVQPETSRLSEVERLAMRGMFVGLIETIENELRARLLASSELPDSPEFRASMGAAHVAIAWPILANAGMPEDSELIDTLIRHARAYSVTRQLRRAGVISEDGRLDMLTDADDAAIAASAMKLLIAESRFNDRFEDPRLGRSDLPDGVDRRLVWTVAAALRDYGERVHRLDGSILDFCMAKAARQMLDDHGEDRPIEVTAMALAAHLKTKGLVDSALLIEALNGARLALYIAMLAVRAGMAFDIVWDMAINADAPSHMIILKSIGIERDAASHLLTAMTRAVLSDQAKADARAVNWIESYDALSADDIEAAMRSWRLDSVYRGALARFSSVGLEAR